MDLNEEIGQLSRICAKMIQLGRLTEREQTMPYLAAIFAALAKAQADENARLPSTLTLTIEAAKRWVIKRAELTEEDTVNLYAETMIRADLKSRFEGKPRHDLDSSGQRLKPGT